MTVPDLNLSVRQLLINHARGINSNVSVGEELYFDDEIIKTPIDMTDLDTERKKLAQKYNEIKKLNEERKQKIQEEESNEKNSSESNLKTPEKSTQKTTSKMDD